MALAKYAEDNLEIYLERMERKGQTEMTDYAPQNHVKNAVARQTTQSRKQKEYETFLAMFTEESCFMR